jgi:outer membrane protein TolC
VEAVYTEICEINYKVFVMRVVRKNHVLLCIVFLGMGVWMVIFLSGCSAKYYKKEADREVYGIIDSKWEDAYGVRTNYEVNDLDNQSSAPTSRPVFKHKETITLLRAVGIAIQSNRDYQTQKENLYLTALALTLERHKYVPQLSNLFEGDFTRFQTQTTVNKVVRKTNERQLNQSGNVGVDWLLADGGRISANIASDWMRFLTGDPRESLASLLTGSIDQPLLRGAGRWIVQENLTQAERSTLYQIRSFNRYRKTFLVSVVSDYYRVLQAENAVENAKNNYDMLILTAERVGALYDAGRLPQLQVDQAEQDKLSAWDNLIRSQETYENQIDAFKLKLGISVDAEIQLDREDLAALEKKGTFKPSYTLKEAVEVASSNRLDLANLKDGVEDSERKVNVAENAFLPDFNLVAGMNVSSPEKMRYGSIEFNGGTYNAGYRLNLPLERKAERNAYRQALISQLRQERNYEQGIDQIVLEVRTSYRFLEETAKVYEIQQKSLDLANKRVESTTMLLDAGRAITRDLLESQSALLSAQNAKTSALVSHTIAMLAFFRDIEMLQVQPDGYWEIKETEPRKD